MCYNQYFKCDPQCDDNKFRSSLCCWVTVCRSEKGHRTITSPQLLWRFYLLVWETLDVSQFKGPWFKSCGHSPGCGGTWVTSRSQRRDESETARWSLTRVFFFVETVAHNNCAYFRTSVEYLDGFIDSERVQTDQSVVTATTKTRLTASLSRRALPRRGVQLGNGTNAEERAQNSSSISLFYSGSNTGFYIRNGSNDDVSCNRSCT